MKKTLLVALLIVALSGCGLKGSLYLEDTGAGTPTAPTPPSESSHQ